MDSLKESITRFGLVDPIIANSAPERADVVIGGHMRLKAAKELGIKIVPVAYINLPDIEKERELNIRLNRNMGEFDYTLLREFNEAMLADAGFSSEELDEVFKLEEKPEKFDLDAELAKLDISEVKVQKGEIYQVGDSLRLMIGDSTVEEEMLNLMGDQRADMVLTDPPYRLSYLSGKKKNGKPTEGFGLKRDRKYLETDELPLDFTTKWMSNVAKVCQKDFSIICYENWKNIREIWNEMEAQKWKVRNLIVWHLPNRTQGFSAKHKLFSKHDIAVVGTSGGFSELNVTPEEDALLQSEYETALFATNGHPYWQSYGKGKGVCPTDHMEYIAADEKSSGQSVIFGTKPVEILKPYIKIMTERGDLVLEPFGGSGSTGVACYQLQRRCFTMEKVPTYAEVILKRWEKFSGKKAVKIA